jgi:hypothetical protein
MGSCGPNKGGGPPFKASSRAECLVPERWTAEPATSVQSGSMGLGLGMGGEIGVLGKRITTEQFSMWALCITAYEDDSMNRLAYGACTNTNVSISNGCFTDVLYYVP